MQLYPGAPTETRPSLLPKLAIKPWIKPLPDDLILTNALVIQPSTGSSITIKKGIIVSVESVQLHHERNGDGDEIKTIDLNGAYLDLIDCHVHVTAVPGVKNMSEVFSNSGTRYKLCVLHTGFTTVRDTGGLIEGPRLIQCGKALSQTGGHGDIGPGLSGGSSTGCCDGVPQVLKATREELKAGADFIKIMVGGGVASETDAIETEIQAITTTCKQMGGKMTTAHAYTVDAIRHAIDNGVTATCEIVRIMVRPPFQDFLPPDGKIKNAQVMAKGLEALRIAHAAGVTICYGSDLLTSLHALQTEEFAVRASVLPSSAILKHATTNAAQMLGKSSLIGAISAGAYADLLILDANPLEDVTVLDRPEDHLMAVMKQGRVISSRVEGLIVNV
ncbi:hypothetical protein B0H11DRAFT_1970337 [Mycena galericulata]|nr:hypothetical protein B0H11DRAFT_1970337 [Mycena galericulata]